jgi:hypothetical protein
MAEPTIAQQKKLIKTLKTPERFYKIDFGRYGGEVAMGEITKEQYEYWADKDQSEFEEYMVSVGWDTEEANKDIPKQAQFDREFYEYEDICHFSGPEFADGQYMTISEVDKNGHAVRNEDGDFVDDETVNMEDFEDRGAKVSCVAEHNAESESCKNKYYVFGQYFNKGGWYTDELIKTGPDGFDFKKLEIAYEDCDGFKTFSSFTYNDEEYYLQEDSTGKSSSFYVAEGDEV